MNKEAIVDLIKGEFTPDEATEILFSIIGDKIRFNNRQIFSLEVRNIGNPEKYKTRLEELKVSKEIVSKLIQNAKKDNCMIEINSTILIKINQ
ncbi:hypothetical protein Aeqsu_2831 [Aequorivita sublithincola DSM 14238]|uniref:Uncharacterized protein n=1 Tax=Aequorivita sublithincola (strain DSM 14238 / LMG 21431 / ACAM 643 / 9-3) TaxID=746697 RepID=I3YZ60_AEQSU|nr:hypothetical protein [Aequorivita sublithincola]AFL82278.1 hypothetical protein Aeqsu_2831 [Aequorivita sublithincola DSM 14238]